MLAVPGVGRRDAQRAAGLALVVRIDDVVVGFVGLLDSRVGVGRRAVLGAEAADVHVPEVEARLALGDPLGNHPADPARSREAVGAEPSGDEEAANLGLAETELVVGGEGLGAVDQLRDLDLLHHRDPALRVLGDLLEAVPVLLQQAAVEVGRDAVEAAGPVGQEGRALCARSRPSPGRRPPRGSRRAGRGRGGSAGCSPSARSRNGWVTRYWCDIGITGMRTPARRPISAAYMPAALTTTSASIGPLSV